MKLLNKIKDRYNILTAITLILLVALTFRLASLTIAQGDYYRQLSDTKRVKEIHTTAPRGEIRDRYGRLLAGNVPRFTVQLFKDEISRMDSVTRNQSIVELIRLLEEDGVSYVSEYPIDFNVYNYNSTSEYFNNEKYPIDKVIDILLENNLMDKVLDSNYINRDYREHFTFITANKALYALRTKGRDVPIDVEIEGSQVNFFYTIEDGLESWKSSFGIKPDADAKSALVHLIGDDISVIRTILNHPIARELVYNILVENNLQESIVLKEYANIYEENFTARKMNLMRTYDEVTLESSAKEDFANIFINHSIENFLYRVFDDEEEEIIPGQILIDLIERIEGQSPVAISISEEDNTIVYNYIGDKPLEDEETPVGKLIEKSIDLNILKNFVVDDQIKRHAQQQLLEDGVNPRISIAAFEYVEILNLNQFNAANNVEEGSSVEETLDTIVEKYGIDESLSKYEKRSVLMIHTLLQQQGHLAYQPINIAYGIKDVTVARIEEGLADYNGVDISIEPVRYYPEGNSAAHILGTLGKISQPNEIEKYVVQNEYSPNAIIGKTGIEESFEDDLNGKNGIRKVEVDVVGNTTNTMDEEKAIPGDTVYLTIDSKLQKTAEEALQQTLEKIQVGGLYESQWGNFQFGINNRLNRPYEHATSGAIVAVDVKTGQLLAMTSFPAYDPNLFSTGISTFDWQSLFPEDEENPMAPRPLYNVATQTALEPGSTYKMVMGLAALDKGLNPNAKVRDMGYVTVGNQQMNCLIYTNTGGTHGLLNFYEALEVSCNYYFYTLALGRNQRTGESIGVKVEIEDVVDLSTQLGLNHRSGIEINIPTESSGGVPNPALKIINAKNRLRSMLNSYITYYIREDVDLTESEVKSTIDEITSWLEYDELLTRGEVAQRLNALGLEPEKKPFTNADYDGDNPNSPQSVLSRRDGLTDQVKYGYLNETAWTAHDSLQVSIGQGYGSYTPIQMAKMLATMVNGGYRHNMTLIDSIKTFDNSEISHEYTPDFERILLNDYENLEHIKQGMKRVSDTGTARRVFADFPIETGSKTGTAQRGGLNPATKEKYDDFAWFVGFAPYDDPEIAVAATIFQGGTGGHAGPMVRDVIAEYLGLNMLNIDDGLPYENSSLNP